MEAKIILAIIETLKNEELRNNIILGITILVVLLIFIILIPLYILLNPIEVIKNYFNNEEIDIVENIQTNYRGLDYGMGNITINSKFGFPLENIDAVVITAEYGNYDPWNTGIQIKHTGIDLSGIHRDNVLAVEKGEVVFSGIQKGYGNCVELKHNVDGIEIYTFYAHLSSIGVEEGQQVEQGYIIAKEGGDPYTDQNAGNSTGHHLHFEVEQVIYNDNVDIDIEIEKRGFIETQGKDNIYYDFKNIHNNSNVALDIFTWIDVIPTDAVRIDKVYTVTWNEDIFYSVYYKTNKKDYKQFIENLDSRKVYELDFKDIALENDEYITEFKFEFGTVKSDFHELEKPIVYVDVLDNLKNGYKFKNKTIISGSYLEYFIEDYDEWNTVIYNRKVEKNKELPKTGK